MLCLSFLFNTLKCRCVLIFVRFSMGSYIFTFNPLTDLHNSELLYVAQPTCFFIRSIQNEDLFGPAVSWNAPFHLFLNSKWYLDSTFCTFREVLCSHSHPITHWWWLFFLSKKSKLYSLGLSLGFNNLITHPKMLYWFLLTSFQTSKTEQLDFFPIR